MKFGMQFAVLFLIAAMAAGSGLRGKSDRTITKVVKVLQEMLTTSKAEGEAEREIYSKFKCFCDTSEAEKKSAVKAMTKQITLLESEIEALKGHSAQLSSECNVLDKKMTANKQSRDNFDGMRKQEKSDYDAEDADFQQAISQMEEAINTLASIGADQTDDATRDTGDHDHQMGHGFLQTSVSQQLTNALNLATNFMNTKQKETVTNFMQAPFTGTYTSQSGEVIGILKNMRDTFKTNKATADAAEAQSIESYEKFMKVKQTAFDKMEADYNKKQGELSDNDERLAGNLKKLETAQNTKKDAEDFLAELQATYEEKTKGYENRKTLRANEDAAIAECVSILNSDAAFETFGKTQATSEGFFLQMSSIRRHQNTNDVVRHKVKKVLEHTATKSTRVSKVLASLEAHNPFDTVLKEIDTMIKVIAKEEKADQDKKAWCDDERGRSHDDLEKDETELLGLEGKIDQLEIAIDSPETGTKHQIQQTQDELTNNRNSQKESTTQRSTENTNYQKNIKNLVQSQSVLSKAIKVLKNYYDDLAKKLDAGEAAFVQNAGKKRVLLKNRHAQPESVHEERPEAWEGEGAYEGQSTKGNAAITELEWIQSETHKEEEAAHEEEMNAQHDFEDEMARLKSEEADAEVSLSELEGELADQNENLFKSKASHKSTTADKKAIEAYLESIKAGCDFIDANLDKRAENRVEETGSLQNAQELIKGTPAYTHFQQKAREESFGKCKDPCLAHEAHVDCKACLADVSNAGYCAGHPGTEGCE